MMYPKFDIALSYYLAGFVKEGESARAVVPSPCFPVGPFLVQAKIPPAAADEKGQESFSSSRRRWPKAFEPLVVVLFATAGVLCLFHPMLFSRFEVMQRDPGDGRFNHYILEHSYRWIAGDPLHRELWNPPFFSPEENVLAYSDTLLAVAPPYWLMRASGLPADPAFGWWMVIMAAATYLAGYAFLRHGIGRNVTASAFGAWLMAFASSRMSQLTHHQLLGHFYTIIAIHAMFVLFSHPGKNPTARRIWWSVFFASFVAQFYAGYYFGFFLFLCLGVALFGAGWVRAMRVHIRAVLRPDLGFIVAVGCIAIVAIAPLALHYLTVANELGVRKFSKAGLPRLASFVWMNHSNWLYGWTAKWEMFQALPLIHEQALGLGFGTFLVLIWYFCRHLKTWTVRVVLTVVLLAILFCCVFPGDRTLFRVWYYSIPGIKGIRVMARVGMLLAIPAGMALACLLEAPRRKRSLFAFTLLAIFCCLEQIHHPMEFRPQDDADRVREIVDALKEGEPGSAFYVSPWAGRHAFVTQLDAMWAGLELGRPTVNGYSGNFPLEYDLFDPATETLDPALQVWASRHPDLDVEVLRESPSGWRRQPPYVAAVKTLVRR